MSLSGEVRRAVRAAFEYHCGYCGVAETQLGGELEIDHFRPVSQGGSDAFENLVGVCTACNRFKGDYWPDDQAPDSLRLLHPGQESIAAHISAAADGRVVGLTARGWFHINWLHLNRRQLIEQRRLAISLSALQTDLTQAQMSRDELQRRIQLLEAEVTLLQEIIRRLTQ